MKKSTKSLDRCHCSNNYRKFLKKPEDFIVREVINPKFLRKYQRADKGVKKAEGCTLFLLKKRNMTTENAINKIAKIYKIPAEKFSYAGLKDKFAVTYQYITVKADIKPVKAEDIEVSDIRKTDKRISVGDLIANEFEITLHNCKKIRNVKKVMNFFGPQRFGKNMNNHIIGRDIIKRNWKKVNIKNIPKKKLKFFVHAYQSYLFNELLKMTNQKSLPIIGYDTKINKNVSKILRKEGIKREDFRINELSITCKGGIRKAFINVSVKKERIGSTVRLYFTLPKGSYATTLMNQICKT